MGVPLPVKPDKKYPVSPATYKKHSYTDVHGRVCGWIRGAVGSRSARLSSPPRSPTAHRGRTADGLPDSCSSDFCLRSLQERARGHQKHARSSSPPESRTARGSHPGVKVSAERCTGGPDFPRFRARGRTDRPPVPSDSDGGGEPSWRYLGEPEVEVLDASVEVLLLVGFLQLLALLGGLLHQELPLVG